MDSILALIIVFWIVSAFSKALNSKKKAGQAGKKRVTTWTSGPAKKPSAAPAEPPPAPASFSELHISCRNTENNANCAHKPRKSRILALDL